VEQGALQEQLADTRSALASCLVAGLQADPEVAGVMGAITSLAMIIGRRASSGISGTACTGPSSRWIGELIS
jgi:hypothetical protein